MDSKLILSGFLVVAAILCCSCGYMYPEKSNLRPDMYLRGTLAYDNQVADFKIKTAEAKTIMKEYFAKNKIIGSIVSDAPTPSSANSPVNNTQADTNSEAQRIAIQRALERVRRTKVSYDIVLIIGSEYVFSQPRYDSKQYGNCTNLSGYYLNGNTGEIRYKESGVLTPAQVNKLSAKNKMGKSNILKKK